MISGTGLGNPDKVLLDNKGTINKKFGRAAIKAYFQKWEYIDFGISENEVLVGVEPAYQYERLKLISINRNKNLSYIRQGKAWGGYGSQITASTKHYAEYKYNSKFVKFVDKWHKILFGAKND